MNPESIHDDNASLSGPDRPFPSPGPAIGILEEGPCLDTAQLHLLESAFRKWAVRRSREDIRLSRRRILMIFLLIRYTGAKLNEVMELDPFEDIDADKTQIHFRSHGNPEMKEARIVPMSAVLCSEIRDMISDPDFRTFLSRGLSVDPGFLRRKFYERAEDCGFSKNICGPEMIRKARTVELMKNNMPMPAVQKVLGHSTPVPTIAHVSFSEDDIRHVTRIFMDREASRRTSARNAFFGKIQSVEKGTVQSLVTLSTFSGQHIRAIITNRSLEQLGLGPGKLVTAEVKAPWIILQKGGHHPGSSADNRFEGTVQAINQGKVSTEYTVRIPDGTLLCAVVSSRSVPDLGLKPDDKVQALFNCFAVILNTD